MTRSAAVQSVPRPRIAAENDYRTNPFAEMEVHNRQNAAALANMGRGDQIDYGALDLDVRNYLRDDLLRLFQIAALNRDTIQECKKRVLRTHPDKSRLDPAIFIFYSEAYTKLHRLFTEETMQSTQVQRAQIEADRDAMEAEFKHEHQASYQEIAGTARSSAAASRAFNERFQQTYVDTSVRAQGYGDWLESGEGLVTAPTIKSAGDISAEMNKLRKQSQQAVIAYTGFAASMAHSSAPCTELMGVTGPVNHTSTGLFTNGRIGFTDLRQAYTESLQPVPDVDDTPRYRNVAEYEADNAEAMVRAGPVRPPPEGFGWNMQHDAVPAPRDYNEFAAARRHPR